MNILDKIKKAKLVGRGGACFPTALKWSAVAEAMANKASGQKVSYVICNAAEGEPGVKKDGYVLEKHPDRVIDGIKIATQFLSAKKAYIYINETYSKKYSKTLKLLIGDSPIVFFIKPRGAGYIGGEESAILNAIEGKKIEPRLKPPFPPTHGLFGQPTLINNVETLYNVSLVDKNEFSNKRFYTINGDCLWTGVYDLPDNYTIEKILKETNNYPEFDFFVQVGGDASGIILNQKELKVPATGAASITVYSILKYKPQDLIKKWMNFFMNESCGQCTPCREGTYRIMEILESKDPNWNLIAELLDNLDDTAFCGLGCAVSIPVRSYIKNVLSLFPDSDIKIKSNKNKLICECF
jgi:NADH:ubiquinone oxidoreductase subunit F (NADH-binding)